MKKLFSQFLLCLGVICALGTFTANAQGGNKTIKGVVSDAVGTIAGANVLVKGTNNGTTTDANGAYTLSNVSSNAVIEISFIGYKTSEVSVSSLGTSSVLNVTLVVDAEYLEDVVVIGYGTQKKGDVSSAIATVKSENFLQTAAIDAAQLIKGQVPGLTIISADGNPTGTSSISLRGTTTLKAGTSPLILIDGIQGNLNDVSPDAIEQIDVLKDGSAAAIYGTRGTNGVILITTKNANGERATKVNFNAFVTTQQITRTLDFMSAEQYRARLNEFHYSGMSDDGASVNWLDEVTRTPFSQNYNISISGGNKTTNYIAGFDYRDLQGIMKKSNNVMLMPRFEITHRMFNNMLKISAGVRGFKQTYYNGGNGSSFNTSVYQCALTYNPTTPIYDENGKYSENTSRTDYYNPVSLINEIDAKTNNVNLNMHAAIDFTPFKDLTIRWMGSTNTRSNISGYSQSFDCSYSGREGRTGYAAKSDNLSQRDLSELTAQYNKTFAEKHTISAMIGGSYTKYTYESSSMSNYDFTANIFSYNNIGNGAALKDGKASMSSYKEESKLIGAFARASYNFDNRYVITASIRHEGSSKFGTNHKWGTFPAVSGAWNIINEEFMKSQSVLSNLRLRAGYGVTGTEPGSSYMSVNTLGNSYVGFGTSFVNAIRPASNANPDLKWEKKAESNIGLDLGFLDGRIGATIDVYNRQTTDLIWDYTVPNPPYMYSSMTANAGTINNKGLEIGVNFDAIKTKDFQWKTSANMSLNKNTLVSLSNDKFISIGYSDQGSTGEPIQTTTHRIQEGQPIGNFYGFKTVDISPEGLWIIEGADGNPKPIEEQQPEDKTIIGNGVPKVYANFNNSFTYKGLDVTVTMRGAFGFDILNGAAMQYDSPVMLSRGNVLNSAFEKKFDKTPLAYEQSLQYVSYYIEKGDYWKIDNLTIGYSFNTSNVKSINKFRLYTTIGNLATITGYSGIDPEMNVSGLTPSYDNRWRYPATRSYTVGVSLTF